MHLRTLIVAALAVSALAPAASALPTADAQNAGLGVRLLDAPTALRNDPRARIYIIDHVPRGATIRRHIALTNSTNSPLTASVYVGGADVRGGSFVPTDKGTPSELSSWASVDPTAVALSPRQSKTALVTIAVPNQATDGERYGVIWAELPPDGGSVKAVNRVGIRIYLSVGNGPAPKQDFTIQQLQAQRLTDGVPLVQATVRNTGERALDLNGSLSLSNGPGGLSGGPFAATLGTTLGIGDTEPITVALPKAIIGGPWTAKLTLRSDEISDTVTGALTFPDAGQSAAPVTAVSAKASTGLPVVGIVACGLIGLLMLVFLVLLSRRRERFGSSEASSPGRP